MQGGAPPRTPSPPPSRFPSFAGSQPSRDIGSVSGITNMGQMNPSLPPLPPAPPSTAATVGRVSQPSLQSSPASSAAQYDRIRESVTGQKKSRTVPQREGGANRGMLFTGIALALILVAVGIAAMMIVPRLAPPDRSSPQATITGYFSALQQDDFNRAWQFVSANRNDAGSQDSFTQTLRSDDTRYGKVISIHIVSVNTDTPNHATAIVQATRANDTRDPVVYSISLSQYDGATWLMDSITNQ